MKNILDKYKSSYNGLTEIEVQKRQKEYGLNSIEEKKSTPLILLFLSQFADILIILLLVAAIASYAIGDVIDAGVIILAVLLNVIMGFIQEYRSQKAMESLKNLIIKKAVVKRDDKTYEIDAKYLTIGDIVLLEEGVKVPADLELINVNNLTCDESYLTGESEAISKESGDEVYMDSNILSGNAIGVVKNIGMKTEIGKIAEILK